MFILALLHGQCVNCLLLIICAVLYGCVSMSKNGAGNPLFGFDIAKVRQEKAGWK